MALVNILVDMELSRLLLLLTLRIESGPLWVRRERIGVENCRTRVFELSAF